MRNLQVPPTLYRAYGAQFAARRDVLHERSSAFYVRLLRWLVTHYDDMARAGFLNMWRAYTTKEKVRSARRRAHNLAGAASLVHQAVHPPV